jgi:hypothetical protein
MYSPSFTASIEQIDKDISDFQDDLLSLPRSNHRRPAILLSLALIRLCRFLLLHDGRGLETSNLQSICAIFLPFRRSIEGRPNLISTFSFLTEALFWRSREYEEPGDVMYCIKYLHYLRDQSVKALGITSNRVTASIVRALAFRVELGPGNVTQGVEEMSILCRELLSSDLSGPELNVSVEDYARAVLPYLYNSWNPSQQVIECLREANARLPDSHVVSFALSKYLFHRFFETQSNEYYENAIALLDKAIGSHSPEDGPGENLQRSLTLAAQFARYRFVFNENPDYLEDAIIRTRAHLGSISLEDPERGDIIQSLVELERQRFDGFGITNGIPEATPSNPEIVDLSSFSHLTTSLAESNAVKRPSMTTLDRFQHLRVIDSIDRITNKADIEEAIKYCRLLLTSLQNPDDAMIITSLTVRRSGNFLYRAFTLTDNPVYLNESILIN